MEETRLEKLKRVYANTTLDKWLEPWTRKSQSVQLRLSTALAFLQKHYARPEDVLSRMRAIDFSREVALTAIPAKSALVASRDPRVSPAKGVWFTKSGHPVQRLGVASAGNTKEDPREVRKVLYRYLVVSSIPASEVLMSRAAAAADTWSSQSRVALSAGGGLQYLIPNHRKFLKVEA